MEPNIESTTTIDTIESVGSLMMMMKEKMIDSLPNEMLRTVLDKLDPNDLIVCSGVNRLWLAVVEDICRNKKSIVIKEESDRTTLSMISDTFNGFVHFNKKNCVIFKFKYSEVRMWKSIPLSAGFCVLLVKLFPQVKNLIFRSRLDYTIDTTENLLFLLNHPWSSNIENLYFPETVAYSLVELSDHMDNLTSLKRLHDASIQSFGPSTLARLEHCSLFELHIENIIPHLGPSCTSLSLDGDLMRFAITDLAKLNAQLVKGLTHFTVSTFDPQVLPFVCLNFGALQMFKFGIHYRKVLDTDMIAQLARLTKLTELSIESWSFNVNWTTLANSKCLKSIRILSLSVEEFIEYDANQFCRVLSNIFPNLHQLTIKHKNKLVRDEIAKHLNHFVHLRKH